MKRVLSYIFPPLIKLLASLSKFIFSSHSGINIIFFLPIRSRGWILEYLWFDLFSSSRRLKQCSIYPSNIFHFAFVYFIYPSSRVVVFTDGIAMYLTHIGFDPRRFIVMYTHSKFPVEQSLSLLSKCQSALFMNRSSLTDFTSLGLPNSKSHYFPIGFDPKLFYFNSCNIDRDISFCFPLKYVSSSENQDYYTRKNHALVIAVANALSSLGFKIALLGPNWNRCSSISKSILTFDLPHTEYRTIYTRSKSIVCLSKDEGGFTATLESISCGCSVISFNHGFASDLSLSRLSSLVTILFYSSSVESIVSELISHEQSISSPSFQIPSRKLIRKELVPFTFQYLSRQLLELSRD